MHTIVSCQRVLDVIDLVESDPGVQIAFTVAPDVFNRGVRDYLEALGALTISWQQATQERFHLAVAASYGGLSAIHAPLMMMAHGAGHGKMARPPEQGGPIVAEAPVYGLDAHQLLRAGRVLPSALVLAHDGERQVLERQCPAALPVAVMAGDICYDRLLRSLPQRPAYRRALEIGDEQRLVVVSSTWGHDGIFGATQELLPALMSSLPAGRFRVAALLHPAIWAHGHRQVRAWTAECRSAGLILPAPTEDWRAVIAAADHVVGDHGSVTAYAAAAGIPLVCVEGETSRRVAPGTAQELVLQQATRVRPGDPWEPQLRNAVPLKANSIVERLTSYPGEAGERLRRHLYRLLGVPQPGKHRQIAPVPVPRAMS
ncbi:hypothetical protein [Actinoplanes sp. TFC3]|uniref:hypothetical protein n=1 Tax=Actinoplanes sp. TFC3 TaxID=1710355 RepID=UPI0012907E1D|nr:hypothetical protein [Actinoplanes sp. TFC3]